MKIAVIGAGMQGSACAFDLARSEGVGEVRLLDQDGERLAAAKSRIEAAAREAGRAPAVTSQQLDVTDGEKLSRAIAGCQVAVSAVPYFLNVAISRVAIRAHASFCDMGGNTDVVREELSLDDEAKAAGVSLVPDCGLAPGLGNILVADGFASLDRTTEAHIRVGGLPRNPRPPLNYNLVFSTHGLINEYVGEATYLRGGRRTAVPALTDIESIEFPPPAGRCEAFVTAGGTSTLPWTFEGKVRELTYKTVRYPGHAEIIRSLAACGLFSLDPVEVPADDGAGRVRIRPREVTAAALTRALDFPGETDLVVLRVTVKGTRSGKMVTRVYEILDFMDEVHGITAMMRTTAFPVSVVAQMLARGEVTARGALPLELALPTAPFLKSLAMRGIDIKQSEVIEEAA
jgi:lysine 6-dehydrogenase